MLFEHSYWKVVLQTFKLFCWKFVDLEKVFIKHSIVFHLLTVPLEDVDDDMLRLALLRVLCQSLAGVLPSILKRDIGHLTVKFICRMLTLVMKIPVVCRLRGPGKPSFRRLFCHPAGA